MGKISTGASDDLDKAMHRRCICVGPYQLKKVCLFMCYRSRRWHMCFGLHSRYGTTAPSCSRLFSSDVVRQAGRTGCGFEAWRQGMANTESECCNVRTKSTGERAINPYSKLRNVTPPQIAEAMVAVYGMSDKIGLLNFGQNDASNQFYKPYSYWAPIWGHVARRTDVRMLWVFFRRSHWPDDRQRDARCSGSAVREGEEAAAPAPGTAHAVARVLR